MRYKSNLEAPDLDRFFPHMEYRPMGHSFGHSIPSDWADKPADDPLFGIYKRCGCFSDDERAILATVARAFRGAWLDIGCHTGLTSKTINWVTNDVVACVDPMLGVHEFRMRFASNTGFPWGWQYPQTSADVLKKAPFYQFAGVLIDGDHEPGEPLADAMGAVHLLKSEGVIVLHDGLGAPVYSAVAWLAAQGFKCHMYLTPHVVYVCTRGDVQLPEHKADPFILSQDLPGRVAPLFQMADVKVMSA